MMLPLELFPGSTAVVAELPSRDHSTDLSPEDSRSESWSELLVVVVEDSTIVRERLIRLLTSVAHVRVVGEAATASDAIRTIAELQPDVVTLDLRLEQGSGLEVLRALGGISPKPCVAVLTNYGDAQSRRECLSLGLSSRTTVTPSPGENVFHWVLTTFSTSRWSWRTSSRC